MRDSLTIFAFVVTVTVVLAFLLSLAGNYIKSHSKPDAPRIFNGKYAPELATCETMDYYVDTTTGEMYSCQVGKWVKVK